MIKFIKYFGIFILYPAMAQQPDLGTTTMTNQGERKVAASEKQSLAPQMVDTILPFNPISYPLLVRQMHVTYEPQPIKPARLKVVDPLEKLYSGYVRGGIGMYTSPYLDAWYTTQRDKGKVLSANYRHVSAWDGVKNHKYSRFNDNHLELNGKFLTNKVMIKSNLTGDINAMHFYGVHDSLGLTRADLRQRYASIGTRLEVGSPGIDTSKMNYSIWLTYGAFGDYRDKKDSVKFDFGREHSTAIGTQLWKYHGKERYSLDASLDYNYFRSQQQNECAYCDALPEFRVWNNAILKLVPSIYTSGKWGSVRAGFGIYGDLPAYENESGKFYFWPDAEARFNLIKEILIPYVGVDGSLTRNNYRSLVNENPFMLTSVELRNSANRIRVFGGMRGSLSSAMSFNFGISHGTIANMPLFVTDTTYSRSNRFDVRYDTVTRTEIFGQLGFIKGEKIRINATGSYFIYSQFNEQRAWNLPQYRFGLNGSYNIGNKIIAGLEVYVIGGRFAKQYQFDTNPVTPDMYPFKINDFTDITLTGEYRYSKRLSGYLRISNMVSRRYQLWLDYPAWGINVHGGVTWRF